MDNKPPDLFCQASTYHDLGINVIPAPLGIKKTDLPRWLWWEYDEQELGDFEHLFNPALRTNVGIILGAPSHNLYVVDCEDRDLFEQFAAQVRAVIGRTTTVTSGRGGHIWLRADFPVKPHSYQGFEIKGQGNYVLAPPSRHPDGPIYTFNEPSIYIARANQLPFVHLEAETPPKIPRLAHDIFRGRGPQYKSRSERDQAFIASLANAGFAPDQIKNFILSAQYESKFREMFYAREEAALKWLARSFNAVRILGDRPEFAEAQDIARRWRQWAASVPWSGRHGCVDKAVFLAHLAIAERAGKLEYHASVRDVAELAQMSRDAVSKSQHRLRELCLITQLDRGKVYAASVYGLNPKPEAPQARTLPQLNHTVIECQSLRDSPEHAIWEQRGLGRTARAIYESLRGSPVATQKALAEQSGRGRATIERILPKLIRHGLVAHTERGYEAVREVDWLNLARELGVTHIAWERRRRHLEQRERHRSLVRQRKGG